ncbi:MAG: sugar acetyltransferase [Gammaproteobacteria bacterium RIFCSPHIGHO2_12_FULL_35_23]|nr:MAG: sugar acetyltransferase [Gammaproteobacteria bacterium RIFCSPHIGHO2_12_FULL_35_23]
MDKQIIIIGAGGHAKVLVDVVKKLNLLVLGMVSLTGEENPIFGIKILGTEPTILQYTAKSISLLNGLGMLPGPKHKIRQQLFEKYKAAGYSFVSVIHPCTIIGLDVQLGEGVQIMAGAVIQPSVVIGNNTIINTKASIDHDCIIGEHCHVAPGATLSGNVIVKNNVHIGTGASIIQGVVIGENSVIAAGATVYKDVLANTTYLN